MHSQNTAAPDGQKGVEQIGLPAVSQTEHAIRAQFLLRQPAYHPRRQPSLCLRPPPRLQGRRAFIYTAGPPGPQPTPAAARRALLSNQTFPQSEKPATRSRNLPNGGGTCQRRRSLRPSPVVPALPTQLPRFSRFHNLPRLAKASRTTPWHCRVTQRAWNPFCRSSVSIRETRKIRCFCPPGPAGRLIHLCEFPLAIRLRDLVHRQRRKIVPVRRQPSGPAGLPPCRRPGCRSGHHPGPGAQCRAIARCPSPGRTKRKKAGHRPLEAAPSACRLSAAGPPRLMQVHHPPAPL